MIKNIILLMGPTASGKSALAVELAETFSCEIISVDSMAVYQYMNIGTAKPTSEEKQKVPHHLIDICKPTYQYSVVDFCNATCVAVDKIQANGNIPLLSGGTMFYFYALLYGISPMPSADLELRSHIDEVRDKQGNKALHEWLQEIDPESAKRIHQNDSQRLQRALEVCIKTGKKLAEMPQGVPFLKNQNIHIVSLDFSDREILHQRIAQRFDQMLERGICEELMNLLINKQINPQSNAMKAVGYQQVWCYLSGQINHSKLREKAIHETRQLAKRQLTWMKKMPIDYYYHVDQIVKSRIISDIDKVLS